MRAGRENVSGECVLEFEMLERCVRIWELLEDCILEGKMLARIGAMGEGCKENGCLRW